jgi:hypothetical protein
MDRKRHPVSRQAFLLMYLTRPGTATPPFRGRACWLALYAMSMTSIKVMTDYHCFPLWHYGADEVGEIDPTSLLISKELSSSLIDWAAEYDATLNEDDPANSGFLSSLAEADFIEKGLKLAQELKSVLGNVEVYYYHEGIGRDVRI